MGRTVSRTRENAEYAQNRSARRTKEKSHMFYDYSLLFLVVFLACFGLVMIYTSSYYSAQLAKGDSMYYLKRQGLLVIAGIVAMLIVSKIDYRILLKKIKGIRLSVVMFLYIVTILLLLYVLFFGIELNGARRWIGLGPLGTFQPSDFAKMTAVLTTSYIIYLSPKIVNSFLGFIKVMIIELPVIALIAAENLSTAIVVSAIVAGICFVASKKKMYFIVAGILFAAAIGLYIALGMITGSSGFRAQRIDIWLNVETHEKGYQILQGLYAIASGGIFGKGLGQSLQKLGYVPEAQNDMIFSIICEELGLLGAIAIIAIFMMLLWRILIIAISAPDLFGGLICTGVLVQIAIQVIMNIAVVTNSMPSTGVPLPFISYGGTAVAILLVEMGIVLSVSNQIKQ